jgi:hypothetical protein
MVEEKKKQEKREQNLEKVRESYIYVGSYVGRIHPCSTKRLHECFVRCRVPMRCASIYVLIPVHKIAVF